MRFRIRYILLIGILIRLVIMPFFAHGDLLSTYKRAYNVAYKDTNILQYDQYLSHVIEVINLKLFDFILVDNFNKEDNVPFTQEKSKNANLNKNLFIYKLPYLLFDILSFFLIYKIITLAKSKYAKHALSFYFLNPILIFGVYMFGRYETFPIFFFLLGIWLAMRQKIYKGSFALALCLLTRTSFLIFVPVWALSFGKNIRQKILIFLIPISLYLIGVVLRITLISNSNDVKWLSEGTHTSFLFGIPFDANQGIILYSYVIIYTIISYIAYLYWKTRNTSQQAYSFVFISFMLLIQFFAFSHFYPQYLTWIIPVLALLIAFFNSKFLTRQIFLLWGVVSVTFFIFIARWGNGILFDIAAPLNQEFYNKSAMNLIDKFYNSKRLINIARSVFTGSLLIISYLVYWAFKSRFGSLKLKNLFNIEEKIDN